jgi:hypothetical protein
VKQLYEQDFTEEDFDLQAFRGELVRRIGGGHRSTLRAAIAILGIGGGFAGAKSSAMAFRFR